MPLADVKEIKGKTLVELQASAVSGSNNTEEAIASLLAAAGALCYRNRINPEKAWGYLLNFVIIGATAEYRKDQDVNKKNDRLPAMSPLH